MNKDVLKKIGMKTPTLFQNIKKLKSSYFKH